MRLGPSCLMLVLALGFVGCAEGQFADDDAGDLGDAGDKDAKFVEETSEELDAEVPGEDVVPGEDGARLDAAADAGGEMDASMPPEDRGAVMDTGPVDSGIVDTGVIDTGPVDTGVRDTGVIDTGPVDTGVRDTGPVDTGPVDTGPIDTGVVDSGPSYPPILCPLLGTPIPVTCRSRNGAPPCCGPGGICFCEQRTPIGNFCLPCS